MAKVDLKGVILKGVNLRDAVLRGTNLVDADLGIAEETQRVTDLTGADLTDADLSRANLSGATISQEQLNQAKSLEGATMPDGQKYEDWLKDKEDSGEKNGVDAWRRTCGQQVFGL